MVPQAGYLIEKLPFLKSSTEKYGNITESTEYLLAVLDPAAPRPRVVNDAACTAWRIIM